MAKSKKIDIKNITVTENKDKDFTIEGFEGEEVLFTNLSDEIREMIKLGQLNIKITKARKGNAKERKPTYKYKCSNCQKEIKTTEENLKAKCEECNCDFEKVEK